MADNEIVLLPASLNTWLYCYVKKYAALYLLLAVMISFSYCQIIKDEADAVHTPIEISGNHQSKTKAQEMIDDIISPEALSSKMEGIWCILKLGQRFERNSM